MKFISIFLVGCLTISATIFAQNGRLDYTFNLSGKVISEPQKGNVCSATAVQPDGKIIIAGSGSHNNVGGYFIARYNQDGSQDISFGNKGSVVTPVKANAGSFQSIVVMSDGKIIAGGYSAVSTLVDIVIMRFNADGSLDNSFGQNGMIQKNISKYAYVNDMIVQPDGKILITGNKKDSKNDIKTSFVVRYTANGSIDEEFGSNGIVLTEYDRPTEINAITLQSDGKIVTGGVFNFLSNPEYIVVRYLQNGKIDNSFGIDGFGKMSFMQEKPGFNLTLNDMTISAEGSIAVIGEISYNKSKIVLAKFTNDGKPDLTFGNAAYTLPLDGDLRSYGASLFFQQDGKIIAACSAYKDFTGFFTLIRVNETGTKDPLFGDNGVVFTPFQNTKSVTCNTAAFQSNGNIILAGNVILSPYPFTSFAIARYNNDDGRKEEIQYVRKSK